MPSVSPNEAGAFSDGVAVVWTVRNARGVLPLSLRAVCRLVPAPSRIALHDDGSDDATPELAARESPAMEIVRLPASEGPSRGRNLAIESAPERYVLLLDGDASPEPGALGELMAVARRAAAAVTLPRVLTQDGFLQHGPAHMSWAALPRFRGWWGEPAPAREDAGYSAGGGTAMLIDRRFLPEGVLFDEDFGLRLEDADFLYRVALAGGRVAFAPRAAVVHLNPGLAKEHSGGVIYPAKKMVLQSRNRRLLALKSFSAVTLLLTLPLQAAVEIATAALAAREGVLGAYMSGWIQTLRALPSALRARRRIQASRRVGDRSLLTAGFPSCRPSVISRMRPW